MAWMEEEEIGDVHKRRVHCAREEETGEEEGRKVCTNELWIR